MRATEILDANAVNQNSSVMTVKDWLIVNLLMFVPIVGFVMLLVWTFGKDGNENRKNWAKAALLFYVILIGFGVMFLSSILGVLAALAG